MGVIAIAFIAYLIQNVFGFGQNNYVLEHNHATINYKSDEYFKIAKISNIMFNRTTRSFSARLVILKALTKTVSYIVEADVFLSNEYKTFPALRFSLPFCKVIDENIYGTRDALKDSNLTLNCPINPGSYYVSSIRLDTNKFPGGIPFGKYRITFKYVDHAKEILSYSWFGAIVPKNKLQG